MAPWTTLAAAGLPYAGTLETPIRRVPTAIGGTRRVAIVPEAQSAALRPWEPDEVLVVAGPAGFKDFWPAAVADSLARETPCGTGRTGPARVVGVAVELAGVAGRSNVNALELANRLRRPRAPGRRPRPHRARRWRRGRRAARPRRAARDHRPRHHAEAWADARASAPPRPVRDPARAAERPGHPPVAGAPGADPGGRRPDPGRRAGPPDRGRATGGWSPWSWRPRRASTGSPPTRLVLATGGLAGGGLIGTGRRPAGGAAARAAASRPRRRRLAPPRGAGPGRPPGRVRRHPHRSRSSTRSTRTGRRSRTCSSRVRCSRASERSASDAATGRGRVRLARRDDDPSTARPRRPSPQRRTRASSRSRRTAR